MKKLFLFVLILILLVNVEIVLIAKTNFIHASLDHVEVFETGAVQFNYGYKGAKSHDLDSLSELMDQSDQVCLIEINDGPTLYPSEISYEVNVLKTFKGEAMENLKLIEHGRFTHFEEIWQLYTENGYVPLRANEQYIVFLKKAENAMMDNAYTYANPIYTKFLANGEQLVIHEFDESYGLTLDDLVGIDFINRLEREEDRNEYEKVVVTYRLIKEEFNEVYY